MCGWFRFDSFTTGGYTQLMGMGDSSGGPFASIFHSSTSTVLADLGNFTGGYVSVNTPSGLSTGQWYHLGMTWDGTTLRLYVDGAQVNSGAAAQTGGTAITEFGLGIFHDGQVDNAMYWKRALSAAEMALLARSRQPINPSNLIAWLPCFPGAAERVKDYSGQGNNAAEIATSDTALNAPAVWRVPTQGPFVKLAASALNLGAVSIRSPSAMTVAALGVDRPLGAIAVPSPSAMTALVTGGSKMLDGISVASPSAMTAQLAAAKDVGQLSVRSPSAMSLGTMTALASLGAISAQSPSAIYAQVTGGGGGTGGSATKRRLARRTVFVLGPRRRIR